MTPGRATLRAAWNLRGLGLFLVGPVAGVALVAATFGLPQGLLALAGGVLLLSLSLFGLLVRGERRRLSRASCVGPRDPARSREGTEQGRARGGTAAG